MITLTTPITVPSAVGSSATTNYEKFIIDTMSVNPLQMTIYATCKLSSTSAPDQSPIAGTLLFVGQGSPAYVEIIISDLKIHRKINLTAGQQTALQGWINTFQNNLEAGLITVTLAAGVQTTGQ